MPTSARTRRRRVSLPPPWAGAASGGALFTAEKCRKRAGGCGPRTPVGAARRASPGEALRQQLLSSKPSRPILSTPSRLRAGQWNRMAATATELFSKAAPTAPEQGQRLHAPVFSRNIWFRRRGAHRASAWLRRQSASVERTREQFSRRGRCLHRPAPRQRPHAAGAALAKDRLHRRTPSLSGALRHLSSRGGLGRCVRRRRFRSPGQRADVGIGPYERTTAALWLRQNGQNTPGTLTLGKDCSIMFSIEYPRGVSARKGEKGIRCKSEANPSL